MGGDVPEGEMNYPDPKDGTAETLLHALVVAIRDGKHHWELKKIAKCYPRLLNKTNPFLALIDEIGGLQCDVDRLSEDLWLYKDRTETQANIIMHLRKKVSGYEIKNIQGSEPSA
jgi:hypothetical protein